MEAQDSNSDSDDVVIVSVTESPSLDPVQKRPRPSPSPDHTHKRPRYSLNDTTNSDDTLPRDNQRAWKVKDDFPNKDLMELDLPQYHSLLQQADSDDKGPHLPVKPAKQVYDTALSVIACTHSPCQFPTSKATPTDNPVVINYESLRNLFCVSMVREGGHFDELDHQLHSSPVLSFENKVGPPIHVCLKESNDTIFTGKVVFNKGTDQLDEMLLQQAAGSSQDSGHTSHDNHAHQDPPVDPSRENYGHAPTSSHTYQDPPVDPSRENYGHAPTSSHTHQDPPVDPSRKNPDHAPTSSHTHQDPSRKNPDHAPTISHTHQDPSRKNPDHAPTSSHCNQDLPSHREILKPVKDHTSNKQRGTKRTGRHKRAKFFIQPLVTPPDPKPLGTHPCKQPATPPRKSPATPHCKQSATPPRKSPATPSRKSPATSPCKQPATSPCKQRSKPPPKQLATPSQTKTHDPSEPLPFMFTWPLVRAGLTGNMDSYLRTMSRPPTVNPLLVQTEETMSKLQRGTTPEGSHVTLSKEYINKRRSMREEAMKKWQLTDQQKAAIREELYAGGESIAERFRSVSHSQQLVTNDYTIPANIAAIIERYWMKLAMESGK